MVCILDLLGLIVALDVSMKRLLRRNSSNMLSDLLQVRLRLILERFEARLKLIRRCLNLYWLGLLRALLACTLEWRQALRCTDLR